MVRFTSSSSLYFNFSASLPMMTSNINLRSSAYRVKGPVTNEFANAWLLLSG